MTAGLEIRSDAGTMQLTTNIVNPSLATSGIVATATNTITQLGRSMFTVTYTPNGSFVPMCVVRPTAIATLISQRVVNGQYQWIFVSDESIGVGQPYFIFDQPVANNQNFGLEVYNAQGQRTFVMQRYPLKAMGTQIGTDMPVSISGLEDWVYPAGRTYGALFSRSAGFRRYFNAGGGAQALRGYAGGVMAITNGLRTGNIQHSQTANTTNPDPNLERSWLQRRIVVVDLTNY